MRTYWNKKEGDKLYAKIVNEKPVYTSRPKWVNYKGKSIANAPDDILQELGYFKVQETEMPTDAPDGQHYESHMEYIDGVVKQVWSLTDDPVIPEPELSADEALNIIMGVAE